MKTTNGKNRRKKVVAKKARCKRRLGKTILHATSRTSHSLFVKKKEEQAFLENSAQQHRRQDNEYDQETEQLRRMLATIEAPNYEMNGTAANMQKWSVQVDEHPCRFEFIRTYMIEAERATSCLSY